MFHIERFMFHVEHKKEVRKYPNSSLYFKKKVLHQLLLEILFGSSNASNKFSMQLSVSENPNTIRLLIRKSKSFRASWNFPILTNSLCSISKISFLFFIFLPPLLYCWIPFFTAVFKRSII